MAFNSHSPAILHGMHACALASRDTNQQIAKRDPTHHDTGRHKKTRRNVCEWSQNGPFVISLVVPLHDGYEKGNELSPNFGPQFRQVIRIIA
jgi:hypothetical protein